MAEPTPEAHLVQVVQVAAVMADKDQRLDLQRLSILAEVEVELVVWVPLDSQAGLVVQV